jgi:N-acetylglucosaminyl-diphospho-decaprenol L-rhamnosyltransferase
MGACVHIVIVNWNTGDYLRQCLESIALADRSEATISRVTVVDNASSDDSTPGLSDPLLSVELVRNSRNVGFAAACNQAPPAARRTTGCSSTRTRGCCRTRWAS